jgi:hypothetical protein
MQSRRLLHECDVHTLLRLPILNRAFSGGRKGRCGFRDQQLNKQQFSSFDTI